MVDQQAAVATAYASGTPTPARHGPPGMKGNNSHGTQTAVPLRGNPNANNAGRQPAAPTKVSPGQQLPAAPPPPKPRRNLTREYAFQELNRRKQQQYQNYLHRSKVNDKKDDDFWICELCEYEAIYGVPPYAMIRRYEIKDRQERKKAAEKQRLLEKAKMKGRKNKKGNKGGKNNGTGHVAGNSMPNHQQHYDPNMPPLDGDEYYDDEDEYGDEYEPIGPDDHYPQEFYPPPAPAGSPAPPIGAGGGPRGRG